MQGHAYIYSVLFLIWLLYHTPQCFNSNSNKNTDPYSTDCVTVSFATFSSPRPVKQARPVYTGWYGAAICSSDDLRMFPGLGLNEVMRTGGSQTIGILRLSDYGVDVF